MKLKIGKKAQIFTFDLSTSLIVFLLFIAIFIAIFIFSQSIEKKQDFELDYIYHNLENNLKFDIPGRAFFRDYRVDKGKLISFVSAIGTGSIDSYVVGSISGASGTAHGIGLDEANYDVCLYFTDNDGSKIDMSGGTIALGNLEKGSATCNYVIGTLQRNPCEKYSQALSFFKPVLFYEDNVNDNRIVQMNLVVCKK